MQYSLFYKNSSPTRQKRKRKPTVPANKNGIAWYVWTPVPIVSQERFGCSVSCAKIGHMINAFLFLKIVCVITLTPIVVVIWKGIHFRSDTNRTGAEDLSFYPRLLYCLNQMLAVMLLSQHRVLSSKTSCPCGARCIGHAVSTWYAVCSEAPHSQFGEEARPHLCMDEWNRPTPVRRRLSLTQAARDKPIPTGLAPVSGTKTRSLEVLSKYSVFHL